MWAEETEVMANMVEMEDLVISHIWHVHMLKMVEMEAKEGMVDVEVLMEVVQ